MKHFIISYNKSVKDFKKEFKRNSDSISVNYIDILSQLDKYLVYDEEVPVSILNAEIEKRIRSLVKSERYINIYYYIDKLDDDILDSLSAFFNKVCRYYDKQCKISLHINDIEVQCPKSIKYPKYKK